MLVMLSSVIFVIILSTSPLNVGLLVIEVGLLEEELRYDDITGWETPRSEPMSTCFHPSFDNFWAISRLKGVRKLEGTISHTKFI
jgi:hypothetical protein